MPGKRYRTEDFLLDDYFQQWVKHPNPESNAYWQEFLLDHPGARKAIEEAKKLIVRLNFYVEPRSDATKARVKSAIDNAIQQGAPPRSMYPDRAVRVRKKLTPLRRHWGFRVAATIAGLMLLVGAYLIFLTSSAYTEYATGYGETETIVLPDQSIVTLNANSSLRVKGGSWDNLAEREVWLAGEAYFKVEKRKTTQRDLAKFVVHTGKVEVVVVGTRFNVNTRRSETKVVLSSGKVKLTIQRDAEQNREEVMMKPGELVAVLDHQPNVDKKNVDPSYYTAWTENELIFDNTPVATIKQLLEDNYGIEVDIQDASLLKREFTGAAPADNIEILLNKLSVVYRLEIIRNGNKLRLKEKQFSLI